ncbi:hypothetical protein BDR07DRAFT_1230539, partial [Suillus spraguei]
KCLASLYKGVSVMCNRQSPDHQDPMRPPEAFDMLPCIGSYRHAVLHLTHLG